MEAKDYAKALYNSDPKTRLALLLNPGDGYTTFVAPAPQTIHDTVTWRDWQPITPEYAESIVARIRDVRYSPYSFLVYVHTDDKSKLIEVRQHQHCIRCNAPIYPFRDVYTLVPSEHEGFLGMCTLCHATVQPGEAFVLFDNDRERRELHVLDGEAQLVAIYYGWDSVVSEDELGTRPVKYVRAQKIIDKFPIW